MTADGIFLGESDDRGIVTVVTNCDSVKAEYIGYVPQWIKFNGRPVISVPLVVDPELLPEVSVTVNRNFSLKYVVDSFFSVSRIETEDLLLQPVPNTGDLLASSGEVFVQKSQLGGGSPMLRGFAANSILLVLDGIRLNNSIYRGGNLQNIILSDPQSLEEVEVIYGPSALVYGSDGLGGVIHLKTRKPQFNPDSIVNTSRFLGRYSSAAQSFVLSGSGEFQGPNWANLTVVSLSSQGDLRSGSNYMFYNDQDADFGKRTWFVTNVNGVDSFVRNNEPSLQLGTSYSQVNLMNKSLFKIGSTGNLEVNVHFSNSSPIPRYDRLILAKNGEPEFSLWEYGPQFFTMFNARYNYLKKRQLFNKFSVSLAYQGLRESRITRKFQDTITRYRNEGLGVYNLNLDFLWNRKRHAIYYGLESVFNDARSTAYLEDFNGNSSEIISRYPPSSQLWMNSFYAFYRYRMGAHTVMAGSRVFHQSIRADKPQELDGLPFDNLDVNNQALTGSVAWNVQLSESILWKNAVSSAFRAPNIDDVSKVFDSSPGIVVVPNANLSPERTTTLNLE